MKNIDNKNSIRPIKNSKGLLLLLLSVFFFQDTVFKYIWNITALSKIFNAIFLLLISAYIFFIMVSKISFSKDIWKNFLIPGFLIFSGLIINVIISSLSNIRLLSQIGWALPWVLFLLIPYLKKQNLINVFTLWRLSYYFMIVFILLGLIDYYLIYYLIETNGIIETPFGGFFRGNFSILGIDNYNNTPYRRFYGFFMEPGTLAMMTLPFILYAFLYKKIIGMIILLTGFILTYSLGGYLGLILLVFLVFFSKIRNKKYRITLIVLLPMLLVLSYSFLGGNLIDQYQNKGLSATVREDNFTDGLKALPSLLISYPFGLPLKETTEENSKNLLYVGSNFIPMSYLIRGGALSFIGYILLLIMSLKGAFKILISNKKMEIEYTVVAISIIVMVPFLFQRPTYYESSLFGLLFVPILIDALKK